MDLLLITAWGAEKCHPQFGGILYPEQNQRNTKE